MIDISPCPKCPKCDGAGWYPDIAPAHAPGCDGSCRNCPVPEQIQTPCPYCKGTGMIEQQEEK